MCLPARASASTPIWTAKSRWLSRRNKQRDLGGLAMASYVGAIDQGTTSTRFIVFDRSGGIVSVAQKEHEQIYPRAGYVEHDPLEIWRNTQAVIADALERKSLKASDLAAIGITNQRETTLLWDRRPADPFHNALVWRATRVDALAEGFAREGGRNRLRRRTGLPLASY